MTIKEVFEKIGSVIIKGMKAIVNTIFAAKAENIAKAGLFIGSSLVTTVLIINSLRNKHKAYSDDSKMSTLDRALALNFADKRNRDHLDPILKDVKKTLGGGKLKNRNHKNICIERKKFEAAIKHLNNSFERDAYNPSVLSELEKFNRDMDEIRADEAMSGSSTDDFTLRRIWNEM